MVRLVLDKKSNTSFDLTGRKERKRLMLGWLHRSENGKWKGFAFHCIYFLFFKDVFTDFREKGRERETET